MTDITFEEPTHTYWRGKVRVPGVTQVLDPYMGLEFADAEAMRIAADFGAHVHQACHLDNVDDLDEDSLTPAVAAYLNGWRRFKKLSGFVIEKSEEMVYNKDLDYAGRLDVIGYFPKKNELTMIDIKTGERLPRTVGPQTAAYAAAYPVRRRMRRFCCLLKPNDFELVELRDPLDFDIFKAALLLHRWTTATWRGIRRETKQRQE